MDDITAAKKMQQNRVHISWDALYMPLFIWSAASDQKECVDQNSITKCVGPVNEATSGSDNGFSPIPLQGHYLN